MIKLIMDPKKCLYNVCFLAFLLFSWIVVVNSITRPGYLKLSGLLRSGKFEEAQSLSRVTPDMGGVSSYSGYFTVNEECGDNLFFWFFPARNCWEGAPVLLWLNGGPGASSLNGLFSGVGPFNYSEKSGFIANEHQWTKDHNIVFLDQPAGTGFSFSVKDCSVSSVVESSRGVYSALTQFFKLFPNLQKNKFFLTGESYAGHFVPVIANEIHKRNLDASLKINLVGILIASPYLDLKCHNYGYYLYEMGVVDVEVRDRMIALQEIMGTYINAKDYLSAMAINAQLQQEMRSLIPSKFNIRLKTEIEIYNPDFSRYLQKDYVKHILHVGDQNFTTVNWTVFNHFGEELFKPVTSYIEDLLMTDKYLVGLYGGQLDAVCPYTSVSCVLQQVRWPGAARYKAAPNKPWYVSGRQVGWFKVEGKLFQAVLKDCGHFTAADQPEAVLAMIRAVTSQTPDSTLLHQLKTKL